MGRVHAVLLAVLLLVAAPAARAESWSTLQGWLERDSEVLGLTYGQWAMIGGGVAVAGGAALLIEPALVGGIVGGFIALDLLAHAAIVAGAGGAVALGYDFEKDLGIPPFWKKVPQIWNEWTGRAEAAAP